MAVAEEISFDSCLEKLKKAFSIMVMAFISVGLLLLPRFLLVVALVVALV